MSWNKQPISAPVDQAIVSIIDGVDTVVSTLQPILSIADAALQVAQVFTQRTTDPAALLFDQLVSQLETIINDTFGTGIYTLEVNPLEMPATTTVVAGAVGDPSPIIGRWDNFGIHLMTPYDVIQAMTLSFNDLGDTQRPQFSDSASTVALGFIITAPDLHSFLELIDAFMAVFHWPGFDILRTKVRKQESNLIPSVRPDWTSYKLDSIGQLKAVHDSLLELLNTLKGYRDVLDNVKDLIDLLDRKVKTLERIVSKFRDQLGQLKNAANATGIYVFDYPLQTGGNNAVKLALQDPYLQSICTINNGYSAGLLLLGGGPSAAPLSAIKDLIL